MYEKLFLFSYQWQHKYFGGWGVDGKEWDDKNWIQSAAQGQLTASAIAAWI